MVTNNSINSTKPISVPFGGTGVASTTAYAVVCGGTTSTNPLQSIASVGSSGNLLTSNGAGALPTFQAPTTFSTVNIQSFTSTGTYTPTSGMKYCVVEVWGGGGAGGGTPTTGAGEYACGGGGAAGGYARSVFSAATIGASQAVTIGAAAAGVAGGAGNNGNACSLGALISANGGTGGASPSAAATCLASGGIGGTGSGTISGIGQRGFNGVAFSTFRYSGGGASTAMGEGGTSQFTGNYDGVAGLGYGSGGSGAVSTQNNAATKTGGDGAKGIVVVTEFI